MSESYSNESLATSLCTVTLRFRVSSTIEESLGTSKLLESSVTRSVVVTPPEIGSLSLSASKVLTSRSNFKASSYFA